LTAVLLGVFAAISWAILDVIARNFAARIGPFRITLWAFIVAGAILTVYFAVKGLPRVSPNGLMLSLIMGVAYAMGVGMLFKAFSLGPISIVGPITQCYAVLVIGWGLLHGLEPTPLQWLAFPAIFLGIILVARFAPNEGEASAVSDGDWGKLFLCCGLSAIGFASAAVLSQAAAPIVGEVETVWISRLTAALTVLPFLGTERHLAIRGSWQWIAIIAVGILDAAGIAAIAAAGHLPGKEFAVVASSSYGAFGVALAALVLKERVAPLQWAGVLAIVVSIAALGWPAQP
jgi:drug/metabolite transporter (DMT)-like permease